MIDPKTLDEVAKRITDNLPPGFKELPTELEKKLKEVVQSALARLDLVTREEFDVQKNVLLKTREKLEALEAQLAELEKEQQSDK